MQVKVGFVMPPRQATWAWRLTHFLLSLLRPFVCRLQVEGRGNIPVEGGYILTCNHTMGPDYLVIGYLAPRQVYFMVKAELIELNRWLGSYLRSAGCFPVRRGDGDLGAIQHAIDLVGGGGVWGMFPEGTRSRSGQLQRGRSGAAYVAIRAQVPVVPAVVINSEAIVRRSNWLDFKSRPLVTVRVGEPLWPPQDPEDRRGLRVFTREIMQATAALLPDQLVQEVEEL